MSNDYGEPIFDFQPYGGACPECGSENTALWIREINEPNKHPTFDEWLSCHDCKHIWYESNVKRMYRIQDELRAFVDDILNRLENGDFGT